MATIQTQIKAIRERYKITVIKAAAKIQELHTHLYERVITGVIHNYVDPILEQLIVVIDVLENRILQMVGMIQSKDAKLLELRIVAQKYQGQENHGRFYYDDRERVCDLDWGEYCKGLQATGNCVHCKQKLDFKPGSYIPPLCKRPACVAVRLRELTGGGEGVEPVNEPAKIKKGVPPELSEAHPMGGGSPNYDNTKQDGD